MADTQVTTQGNKTVLKGLGQCSFTRNGDPAAIDVKDGKILRIRPLHFEDKYTKEEIKPWRIEKDGKVLEPKLKSHLAPYMLAYKKRVYSPNRILYPLIREDWDPTGAPSTARRPQRRRTAARASTSASPGTRRPTSSPPRSSGCARPTAPTRCSATVTATARPRWCTVPIPARCCSWRRWAATPRPSATPTAGRAGTGAPSTCGARAPRATRTDADNVLYDITQHTQDADRHRLRPRDHALGLRRPVPQQRLLLLERHRHQADLHRPRPQLLRRRPCRQVDPHPAQHRRRAASGDRLHLDQGRHLRQGLRGHPRGRLRALPRVRHGRRRRRCPRPRTGRPRRPASPSGPSRRSPASGPSR